MIFKSTYRLIGVVTVVCFVATIMGCGTDSGSSSSADSYAPSDYTSPFFNVKECTTFYESAGFYYNNGRSCANDACTYINCLHKACFANGDRIYCVENDALIATTTTCIPHNHVLAQCMTNKIFDY